MTEACGDQRSSLAIFYVKFSKAMNSQLRYLCSQMSVIQKCFHYSVCVSIAEMQGTVSYYSCATHTQTKKKAHV